MDIKIWVSVIRGVIGACTFGMLIVVAAVYHPKRVILHTYEEMSQYLLNRKRVKLDYQRLNNFLKQNGAKFHYGKWIEPIKYLAIQIILAVLGLLIGSVQGNIWGIFAMILSFWLPKFLLCYLNSRDNEKMLPELKLLYHALAIQIKAGVYVTDALAECYGSVHEVRLRNALLELSGDIVMKADVEEALERFQGKFDNQYIDSLCITILQALESGQAIELLSDIAEQIKDMEAAVLERKKAALDRSITFYQLGILAAILVVVLYACITHMFTEAIRF